jgi:hypothetical protein
MKKVIFGSVSLLVFLNCSTSSHELIEGKVEHKKTISELLENCDEISNAEVRYAKKIYGKWMW